MIVACRKIRSMLAVFYADMMQYRAELYLWALSGIMPFILMGLWMKASAETDFSLTPPEFARYFLAVFIVRQVTLVWVVWDFEDHVVHGKLSPYLLQPIDPFWRFFTSHISERAARLPFIVLLTVIFFCLYPAALWAPSPASVALAALAMVMAFLLRFIMQYAFAMIAFWIERANAIEDVWFMLYLFLSGFLAPLDVFPPAVRTAALWTPFPYMVYLPANLLIGRPVENLGRGFVAMTAWGLLFFLLYRILWKRGLRHYSAMGA
jgi:ABC-2 type transport system permease protein